MLRGKILGFKNNSQGAKAEILVMNNLRRQGWNAIPTPWSKSPIDIIAYHRRKQKWWGIQVKSTAASMVFDPSDLTDICYKLHMTPVFAYVKIGKRREVNFCMMKSGRLYHVFEDGANDHPLGEGWDCQAFKPKIGVIR